MSNSTDLPNNPVRPFQDDETVVAAAKLVRTKAFVKKSFTRIGVPILVGATAALVITRKRNSDSESSSLKDTDTPNE